jgi:hypothetical protein
VLELPNKASITDPQVERAGALTKFTAAQVKENYPKQLRDLGEQAAAHLSEACTHKEKYEQHLEDAKQILDQVRDLCDDSGFAAFYDLFHETFCPNVGRSRTYELLAITTGKKTIENTRADTRERVRRHRAKQKESVTVTDSPKDETADPAADARSDQDGEDPSIAQRRAEHEARFAEPLNSTAASSDTDLDVQTFAGGILHRKGNDPGNDPAGDDHGGDEHDAVIRNVVLLEFFAQTSGADIYDRIPAVRRVEVIATFLDRLTVQGMCEAMSPDFKDQLRDRLPLKRKPYEHTLNLEVNPARNGRGTHSRR